MRSKLSRDPGASTLEGALPARGITRPLCGLCVFLLLLVLVGCGSSTHSKSASTASSPPTTSAGSASTAAGGTPAATAPPVVLAAGVIAQVGGHSITKRVLGQWMTETLASDFYTLTSHVVPAGLVAEPANYPACLTALGKLTPIPGQRPSQPQPTRPQLLRKCQELYETVKQQALEYLINAYWIQDYDAAHGIRVTPAEAQHALNRTRLQYPTPGAYQQTLTENRRTPAQELFIIENDILNQKVITKLTHEGEAAATAFNSEAEHTENTATCRTGYTAPHCKNYKTPPHPNNTPDQPLQEITHWRP
jgi:hypothetical protein